MTKTQQKHVSEVWAIKMAKRTGEQFFACSRDPGEWYCTFSTSAQAEDRIAGWERWQDDCKPHVVRVEIREL